MSHALIVEDEPIIGLDIQQSLQQRGFGVYGPVTTAQAAIEAVKEHKPDIVLMDIFLNGEVDGITAAASIADTWQIPIIFLTAHCDRQTLERAKIVEPHGYIVKPFVEEELCAAIEMSLYRSQNQTSGQSRSSATSVSEETLTSAENEAEFKLQALLSLDLFTGVDTEKVARIAESSSVVELRRGEVFDADASENPSVFLVTSGLVSLRDYSTQGKEYIAELIAPNDLGGLVSLLQRGTRRLEVRAEKDAVVLLLPRKAMLLYLAEHPQHHLSLSGFLSEKLRDSQELAMSIAYDDVRTRILSLVFSLTKRMGVPLTESGKYSLHLSRKDIASLAGAAEETVVRVLKSLEKEGLLELGRRRKITILDIDRLQEAAEQTAENCIGHIFI